MPQKKDALEAFVIFDLRQCPPIILKMKYSEIPPDDNDFDHIEDES